MGCRRAGASDAVAWRCASRRPGASAVAMATRWMVSRGWMDLALRRYAACSLGVLRAKVLVRRCRRRPARARVLNDAQSRRRLGRGSSVRPGIRTVGRTRCHWAVEHVCPALRCLWRRHRASVGGDNTRSCELSLDGTPASRVRCLCCVDLACKSPGPLEKAATVASLRSEIRGD